MLAQHANDQRTEQAVTWNMLKDTVLGDVIEPVLSWEESCNREITVIILT